MRKRILIAIQYLGIGGAERSLLGLLNAIDKERYDVDLFVYSHVGEFMRLIPEGVNLLPEVRKYSTLTRPLKEVLKEGYVDIALARVLARIRHKLFLARTHARESIAEFQYIATATTPLMPSLKHLGEYDLAISFLTPHNIVRDKVVAKQKWAWIHTDYSSVSINVKEELPAWKSYDRIISVSEAVTKGFLSKFPSLESKVSVLENILSEDFVREQAKAPVGTSLMTAQGHAIRLCSVGRFSFQKAFDRAVWICKSLIDRGLDVGWYIVGYGSDEALIRSEIAKAGMKDNFILLGKQANPYPFIKGCDIYVQPSRYEGKAVTVREAQILCKPVVITAFPTSASQVKDGLDGVIVPDDIEGAADGIANLIANHERQSEMIAYLSAHHYGNEEVVEKIYEALS